MQFKNSDAKLRLDDTYADSDIINIESIAYFGPKVIKSLCHKTDP